jgi:hypothetical protein
MPLLSAYEIYQTYLRGPGAIIRLFEQTFGTLALYGRLSRTSSNAPLRRKAPR